MKKQLKRKYWHVTCFDGHNFHAPDGTHILTDWADCEKALDLLNAVNKSIDDARKEVANDRRRKNKAARGRSV